MRRTLAVLSAGVAALRQSPIRILAYHSVSPARTDPWAVHPDVLRAHLQFLRARKYQILSLRQAVDELAAGRRRRRRVVLTFDDGYADFATWAVPILEEFGAPAALFVPLGMVGSRSSWSVLAPDAPLAGWDALDGIARSSVEIGAHGMTHRRLVDLDAGQLRDEVGEAARLIRERWGTADPGLAYPFGDFGSREIAYARDAGYRCALGFGGLWGNSAPADLFALRRDPVVRPATRRWLQRTLHGLEDWLAVARSLPALGRSPTSRAS